MQSMVFVDGNSKKNGQLIFPFPEHFLIMGQQLLLQKLMVDRKLCRIFEKIVKFCAWF